MADNIPASNVFPIPIATRDTTYAGDADRHLTPVALVNITGPKNSTTSTDVPLPTVLGPNGGFKTEDVGVTNNILDSDSIVGITLNTKSMLNGSATVTPKFVPIVASASGNTPQVAAVGGKKIRVLAYNIMANGTVNAKWQSATTDKTGRAFLVVNTGKVVGFSPVGWFETAVGEALNLNLSAAIAVEGELVYVEI